ncbi:hypothetical protein B9Z55_007055 [Caenorhabditis nigoni]|uniref:Uncharacterized protein n=1 Tax=Caenorhabditis nigoni TaxID=1611254 RepID=A0A2G5V800_9PELO|nr:hypothetical protein B9Z55_007055 [Caenorhabditis nigoni]
MVTSSIPMGYEILKTVLLYTDPNLRFKIAQRIPEVRITENAVPLRINSLSLQEFKTAVNSTSYKLGVYRHYHTEDTPISIKKQNREGGVSYDLDQYGFEVPNSSTPILNGDVSTRTENAAIIRRDTEIRERHLLSSLRFFEQVLAKKFNQLESVGKTVEEFLAVPRNNESHWFYVRSSKEDLQMKINAYRTNLLPFHYRRNKMSPPYAYFIQLAITQGNATTYQRYEYNHKLYEAAKKLNETLFGNRPVIIVNQLENMYKCDIWRIPVGFKISANSVFTPFGGSKSTNSVTANSIYVDWRTVNPISSILDPSRTLRNVSVPHVEANYQHSFVKNAQQLSICTYKNKINQLVRAFETMGNQRIHIDLMDFQTPSANEYVQLMQGWLATERRVGSMITLGLRTDQIGRKILELVRTRNERTVSRDRNRTQIRNQYKMTSYSIPMGYESLRAILLHTDPNLRFNIAQRIPKIRPTEQAVPLRVKYLSFEEFRTAVNNKSYELGIYCHYHTKEIPYTIQYENNDGGVRWDVDQYGFEIPTSSTPILNGDISLRREDATHLRRDRETREQYLEFSLRRYEDALAKINQLELEGKTVEEFLAGPMTEDDRRISGNVRLRKDSLQLRINEYRNDLLPFLCRRNNLSPPYTFFIQLTITQGKVKTIQRYAYNYKLYEAAKKLNEILFANRPVIIVNHFGSRGGYFDDVWRIPVGLKISANSLSACFEEFRLLVPISPILDSSRTLRNVSFSFTPDEDSNYQHSFVKNAQQLSILTHKEDINQLARALKTMENQKLQITSSQFDDSSANDYFQLIQSWMSIERSVGSDLTLGLKTEYTGRKILDLVRTQNEITESSHRCVTVLQSNATKLHVSYMLLPEKIHLSTYLLTARIMKA